MTQISPDTEGPQAAGFTVSLGQGSEVRLGLTTLHGTTRAGINVVLWVRAAGPATPLVRRSSIRVPCDRVPQLVRLLEELARSADVWQP